MQFEALREARLIRRYKRFLADVELPGGETLTVHCPNTGAMTGCAEPGSRVWLSHSASASRKYAHTWELVESPAGRICVHSVLANRVVDEAIERGLLPGLEAYPRRAREVPVSPGTRADLVLEGEAGRVVIEVKSVTLARGDGWGAFPDAVSARGRRHLETLASLLAPQTRSLLVFCAMHEGVERVCPAADIDPAYAGALCRAMDAGVEVLALGCAVSPAGVVAERRLPFAVEPA
jgi:sugar fermentation stimulation protein A